MANDLKIRQAALIRETANAKRKAETVRKLLALAELVASDGCDLRSHHMRIEGSPIPWHPDTHWTKELLWGGRRTITLTLVVEPTNGSN